VAFVIDATLTIANGETNSSELRVSQRTALAIFSPGTLPETVTIEVAPVLGGTFVPLQSAGADITIPAGKATEITLLHAGALRLTAGEAVGGARAFRVQGGARR
jgi:hypothetical protein